MIRVGIVGVGFMGMIHYLAYQKARGVKVAAIATRDGKRLAGDWRGIQGNFGPPGTLMDLGPIGRFERWQDLLADPKIDLVDICLPPALHENVAVAALAAGKHVLSEKPIALTVAEGKKMAQTAKRAGKQLLVGHVLPFFPEYAHARQLIAGGKYGRLLGGHFKRIVSDPLWLKDFYDPKAVGGPVVDLHIHDAHFIRLICGMPKAVFSTGRTHGEVVEFVNTQFLFDDRDLVVTAASGVIQQQGRGFTHAFEIYLEKATLLYDFSVLGGVPTTSMPLTVLTPDGKAVQPKLPEVDGFVAELTEAARAVRGGRASEVLSGELALDALTLCHRETESVLKRRLVKI
ncbi:MAG TPA: Gfo/Idh/MocA family oxidoreductase [Pirellulales bacterium]|nr:Gfo/Idh/MocA family oxidoreductase [Pirellulales bacterium]